MKRRRTKLEGSYKPGSFTLLDNDQPNVDIIEKVLTKYVLGLDHLKKEVNKRLFPVYGKDINFVDRIVGDINFKLNEIYHSTGKEIGQLANEIRSYLGYHHPFLKDNRPVGGDKILEAYQATQASLPVEEIEKILHS